MNDQEVEQRLRKELRRRLAQGDPSDRLIRHVAHLGSDEVAATAAPRATTRRRLRFFHGRSSALGGLAAAACIVAVLAASLFWRPSGKSPPAAPFVAWDGAPVNVSDYDRLDAGFAWVVGSTDGRTDALYVTTDGGSTWDKRPVPYGLGTRAVTGFDFLDPDHAFVAVTTGQTAYTVAVMRSSDGGRTWKQSVVLQDHGYDSIEFQMVDEQHGWLLVVDSRVVYWLWATTDGGVTWKPLVDTANQADAPARIDFVSDQEGWGLPHDYKGLVHTLDGGKTWTRASLPIPSGYTDVSTTDYPKGSSPDLTLHGNAWAASGDTVTNAHVTWASTDNGASWRIGKVEPYTGAASDLLGPDVQAAYVAGAIVTLTFVRPDGRTAAFDASGINAFVATGYTLSLTSARAFSGTEAWVTIDACAQGGNRSGGGPFRRTPCLRLLATNDGGKTWHPLLWTFSSAPTPSPTMPAVPACCSMNPVGERQVPREPLVDWPDSTHGWAVVGTNLHWTADGGKTWDSGSPVPASGTIQFLDSQRGWLIATGSSDPVQEVYSKMPVYRTADGGKTWTETDIPWTEANIPTVSPDEQPNWHGSNWVWGHFADSTHGVVARCSHLLAGQLEVTCQSYTTDDGGVTFQGPVTTRYTTAITWLSPTTGWAVGGQTTPVLKVTEDGGRTWTQQPLAAPAGASPIFGAMALAPKPGGGWRLLVYFNTEDSSSGLVRYETAGPSLAGTWNLAWHGADPSPSEGIRAVRIAGESLVGVSDSHFWSSSDFGQTWHQLAAIPTEVHDFVFIDADTGWQLRAPTYDGSPDALLATTDGGKTWHVVLQVPSVVG
jgi:photosystem II stability/assembly factor-like uncharacterized protein